VRASFPAHGSSKLERFHLSIIILSAPMFSSMTKQVYQALILQVIRATVFASHDVMPVKFFPIK
jgi:hypothetical protein